MKKRKKISIVGRKSGFTLIEVMIVLGVIAIMAAIALPNIMSWLPNMRLKAAARDLYSNMQKAKMEAVKHNATVILTFNDGEGGSYKFFVDNGGSGSGTAGDEIQNGDEKLIAEVVFPVEITMTSSFSSGSNIVGFYPTSLPYKYRIGNVILEKSNNDELRQEGRENERRFYKISLSMAGFIKIMISNDGENWK